MSGALSGITIGMGRGRAKAREERDPFAIGLGKRVREVREEVGLTQKELGRRARYDAVQLSRLESGEIVPRADALLRIANVLETTLDRLYGLPAGVSMQPGASAETVGRDTLTPAQVEHVTRLVEEIVLRTRALEDAQDDQAAREPHPARDKAG